MITLTATTAAMLYLLLTLTVLLGIWTYHHYKSRRTKIIIVEEKLLICEYCHFAYLTDISKKVTQCPQCHCFNK